MRQRRVKNLDEKLVELSEFMIENPCEHKGRWKEVFGNNAPVIFELGCGKGGFISKRALEFPDINFVAVEGQASVAVRAAQKLKEIREKNGAHNVRIICDFVHDMRDITEAEEIKGIYLNFSDPWPKERHKKRRLTHRDRLATYLESIGRDGFIEIKTDNDALFEFTMEEINELKLNVTAYSDDLHKDAVNESEESYIYKASLFTTEYEEKFKAQGMPIHFVRIEK